jgi:hypothetical protein
MTIAVEPIYIGGQAVFVKFYTYQRNPGEPTRIEGTFTLMAGEGTLTLDALVGPRGLPGVPAPIMRPQYDSPITDVDDLPDPDTLDDSDNGRGWYIDGMWYVWQNGEYHTVQGSIPGPPGITPDISVTAELVDKGSPPVFGPIDVEESGTTAAPNFNIKVPAVPGPEGPAGAIEAAADYDDFGEPSDIGDFLVKKSATKWGPGTPNLIAPTMYTIPEADFIAHNGSEGRFLIASRSVPAQDVDYYPDVLGHVRLKKTNLSTAQLEVEVRIGDGTGTGETDPLCGLAPYDPSTAFVDQIAIANIFTHFSDDGNPLRSVSPDTSVGRVLAGQAKTFYVFVHKVGGSGGYEFTTPTAHLRIFLCPVYGD